MIPNVLYPYDENALATLRKCAAGELRHYLHINAKAIERGARHRLLHEELLYLRSGRIERIKLIAVERAQLDLSAQGDGEHYDFQSTLTSTGIEALRALEMGLVWDIPKAKGCPKKTEEMFRSYLDQNVVPDGIFGHALKNDLPELAAVRRDLVFFKLGASHDERVSCWVGQSSEEPE